MNIAFYLVVALNTRHSGVTNIRNNKRYEIVIPYQTDLQIHVE